jgi:hypothetical protein
VKLEFTPVCHTGGRGFESRQLRHFGSVAQSVEQRTENPRVGGSIPSRTTMHLHETAAGVAQLVEHLTCNQGVVGSIPIAGTMVEFGV